MRFRDLPPVYTRLGGFLTGSLVHRVSELLPAPACETFTALTRPFKPVARALTPTSWREGYKLAIAKEGRDEPPVLIVPGFMGPRFLLYPLAAFLRAHGRTVKILHTFPALGGVEAIAQRTADAITGLLEETGAARVDLVAHSMGGLACRYYMNHLMEGTTVRRFISIATPHLGTNWAHIPFTRSAADMRPGNAVLAALNERPPAPGVRCITIRAGWDQIVWPRDHGRWESHAEDHELPFAEHWAVQLDVRTLALVLTLLEGSEEVVNESLSAVEGPASAGATS